MKKDNLNIEYAELIKKHLKCCQSNKGFISTLCLSNRSKMDYTASIIEDIVKNDFWLKRRIKSTIRHKDSIEVLFKNSGSEFIVRTIYEGGLRKITNGVIIDKGIERMAVKRRIKPLIKPYIRFKPKSKVFVYLWCFLGLKIKSIIDDLIVKEYYDYIII